MPENEYNSADDARGASQLTVDAVREITGIVESLHKTILHLGGIRGPLHKTRSKGITGFVFRMIYLIVDLVGMGVDKLLMRLSLVMQKKASSEQRDTIVSALNGVIGDYLELSNNPLSIHMKFRLQGKPISMQEFASQLPKSNSRILLIVHGLCMNDLHWSRKEHNHGEKLAHELGFIPLYLHYNTGRHISTNGKEFAELLENLIQLLPKKTSLYLLMHSMGGLISRSAFQYAQTNGFNWQKQVKKMFFLGTPHFGAPMERGGNWLETMLESNPYSKPFSRLGKIRSSGITDLRYGSLTDADWKDKDRFDGSVKPESHLPLPEGVDCYAIVATTSKKGGLIKTEIIGDGLVPLKSGLGEHENSEKSLHFPPENTLVLRKENHMGLLDNQDAYTQLQQWLEE